MSGRADRGNPIVVIVNDESRHINALEILRQIRFGEDFDAFVRCTQSNLHAPQPEHFHQWEEDMSERLCSQSS